MKIVPFPALIGLCLAVITATAHADAEYHSYSDDIQRTIMSSAAILAVGMIVAALILRKPNK